MIKRTPDVFLRIEHFSSKLLSVTMKHELGHAVGLRHPFERDETAPLNPAPSLMMWHESSQSDGLTNYDQSELEKSYPDWVV